MNHLAIIFILLLFVSCSPSSTERLHPNIIYILADDLGYGDLSCLNPNSKIATPYLDKLATQGMTFTDAHSNSAVCTPTRYGILTGRYTWRSRLKESVLWRWDEALIEPDQLTVGDFLKQNGYSTACIGKWHLGWNWPTFDGSSINDTLKLGQWQGAAELRSAFDSKIDFSKPIEEGPVTRGFDYYFGDDVPNWPPYAFIENDKVMGIPSSQWTESKGDMGMGPMTEGWDPEAVMPAITSKAVEYIKNERKIFNRTKDRPFFLYFALTAPHTPIAPTDEFKGKSRAGGYGDYVQQLDWTVGQIMKAVEEEGYAENTLVIFTSDNGSPARDGTNMTGEPKSVTKYGHNPSYHFRGMKADIWEGGHRVPFIVRWPRQIKSGSESNETICLTDFMATCAAIIGKPLPQNSAEDSYNLLPVLKSNEYEKPLREATVHHSAEGQFAIRRGQWKLILGGGSGGWTAPRNDKAAEDNGLPPIQLFDISKDIGEHNNVFDQYPEVMEYLKGLLEKYKRNGRSVYHATTD